MSATDPSVFDPGVTDIRRVFTTVGTDHHPFDRLVGWMMRWHAEHVGEATGLVQHGTTPAPALPAGVRATDLVAYDDMVASFETADAIVCHGGPATIVDARRAGRMPIVVPRRHLEGEHVDDHQVRFTTRMAQLGQIILVSSFEELSVALDKMLLDRGAYRLAAAQDDVTHRAVRAFAGQVAALAPGADERTHRPVTAGLGRDLVALLGTRRARA